KLVMVASTEGKGWHAEIEALCLDLYVLSAVDGLGRCLVAKDGGWPCWADEATVFFHRQADDGWWSIFRITLSEQGASELERITPPVYMPSLLQHRKEVTGLQLQLNSRIVKDKTVHILAIHDVDTIDLKPGERNLAVTLLTKLDRFAVCYIHPDGTGLHKVLESEGGGCVNHPWFSPDSKSIVFTSDEAGVSMEPISVPNQFQPYSDLFLSKADGTVVQCLTHNAYENGTPAWGCTFIPPHDLSGEGKKLSGQFDDSHFLKTEQKLVAAKRVCGRV
ncbi:unnamed protein product, partial [Sphagnum tenellum]